MREPHEAASFAHEMNADKEWSIKNSYTTGSKKQKFKNNFTIPFSINGQNPEVNVDLALYILPCIIVL